ncbi:MAG: hypothetical protein JJU45_07125 [Acidimicrobiia bacterium]|nr:hypothetical protein [Acidimicrobiia bacterium]
MLRSAGVGDASGLVAEEEAFKDGLDVGAFVGFEGFEGEGEFVVGSAVAGVGGLPAAGLPAAGQVAAVSLTVTTEGVDDSGWVVVYAEDVAATRRVPSVGARSRS